MMIQEVVIIVVHNLSSLLLLMHLIKHRLVHKSISHRVLINLRLMSLRDIAYQFLIRVIQLLKIVVLRVPSVSTINCSPYSEVNKLGVIICLGNEVSCGAPERILESHVIAIELSFHTVDSSY